MRRTSVLLAGAAVLLALGRVDAEGYENAPFHEQPVALARAAAIERIEVMARATAASSAPTEDNGDAAHAQDEGPLRDFAFLRASLAAASADLASELDVAIREMTEAAEAGEDASPLATEVIGLLGEARAALFGASDQDPRFRAALMASLLLDEGGVAEAYEEAADGDDAAYAVGWFALQRVTALWKDLEGQGTPEQETEVAATLQALEQLFPSSEVPERLSPDPEEAEGPSQQLVGLLEGITEADLYPGRDLARAADLVRRIVEGGCRKLRSGDGDVGLEELTIAAAYHAATLRDTLGVLAPDEAEAVEVGFGVLDQPRPEEAAAACPTLLDALAAGRAALLP